LICSAFRDPKKPHTQRGMGWLLSSGVPLSSLCAAGNSVPTSACFVSLLQQPKLKHKHCSKARSAHCVATVAAARSKGGSDAIEWLGESNDARSAEEAWRSKKNMGGVWAADLITLARECERQGWWQLGLQLIQEVPSTANTAGDCGNVEPTGDDAVLPSKEAQSKHIPDRRLRTELYNSILRGCCANGRLEEARQVAAEMRAEGLRPSRASLAASMKMLRDAGDMIGVEALAMDAIKAGETLSGFGCRIAVQALAKSGKPQICLDLLQEMDSRKLDAGAQVYSVVIVALTRAGMHAEALGLFKHVEEDPSLGMKNRSSNQRAFRACVLAYQKLGDWQSAVRLLESMPSKGMRPSLGCYNSAMGATAAAGQANKTLEIFASLKQRTDIHPDEYSYSTVISACAKVKRGEDALALLSEMKSATGKAPNLYCYNAAIASCEEWQQALNLLGTMDAHGVSPDAVSYTTAMSACNAAMKWEESLVIWERMMKQSEKNKRLVPTAHAYGALIQAYSIGRRYVQAVSALREMKAQGIRPTVVCYGSAINACARAGKWERASEILAEMRERGDISPNAHCYTAAIKACGEGGQWNLAIQILDQMILDNVRPSAITFATIIEAAGLCGRWNEGISMMKSMRKNGFPVTEICYAQAIRACPDINGAQRLLQTMEAVDGVRPNLLAYNALLARMRDFGKGETALSVLEQMRNAGVTPNAYSYTFVMDAIVNCPTTRADQAFELLEDMKREGVPMGPIAYAAAIRACKRDKKWVFALGYLQEMPQRGVRLNENVLVAAIDVLLDSNQLSLALELFQEAVDAGIVDQWSRRELGLLDISRLPPPLAGICLRACVQDMVEQPTERYYHDAVEDLVIKVGDVTTAEGAQRMRSVQAVVAEIFGQGLSDSALASDYGRFTVRSALLRKSMRAFL
jgi:pentatricopeptide repeat protein